MRASAEEPLVIIAETVSDALNTPIDDLPSLSQSIDPEGVNAIITDDRSHDVTVTFSYAGLRVLIHSTNTVYVQPIQRTNTDRWKTVDFAE
jgi:hypothetical protein